MKNQDKELLIKAIDDYDLYPLPARSVLKTLVVASKEDNTVTLTILKLIQLSKVSRQGVYNILRSLEKDKFLQRFSEKGHRVSKFALNPHKFEEIIEYHNTIKLTQDFLEKK